MRKFQNQKTSASPHKTIVSEVTNSVSGVCDDGIPTSTSNNTQVIILPCVVYLKIIHNDSETHHILQGTFIRPNGLPIQLKKAINATKFSSLLKKKSDFDSDIIFLNEETQTIQMKQKYQITAETKAQPRKFLQPVFQSIQSLQKPILQILSMLGLVKGCRKTRKKLTAFAIEDKRKIFSILQKHEYQEKNPEQCCQKQIQHRLIDKGFPLSCIKQVKEINFYEGRKQNIIEGSLFRVDEQVASIEHSETEVEENVRIACKYIKPGLQNNVKNLNKLKYEKKIVSQIQQKQYIVNYFQSPNQREEEVYMEFIEHTLKNKITSKAFSIEDKFDITFQLTKAIKNLHEDGIVHRDLKPVNILVNRKNEIKLIDFADSIKIGTPIMPKDPNFVRLCATVPYSPLECAVICPESYSKSKIDNWSLGVIIGELINNRLPFCYCKYYEKLILEQWNLKNNFIFGMSTLKRHGIHSIQNIMKILSIKLMKFKYRERFCLEGVVEVLNHLQERFEALYNL